MLHLKWRALILCHGLCNGVTTMCVCSTQLSTVAGIVALEVTSKQLHNIPSAKQ